MTNEQLEKGNNLWYEIENLTQKIETLNKYRDRRMWIKTDQYNINDVEIPDDLKNVILDALDGYFVRLRWDKNEEFRKV